MASYGQKPVIPEGYTETTPPKVGSKEWYLLNHNLNEFQVKIVEDKVVVEKKVRPKCNLDLPDGALIGIDKGEWGGELKFVPTDTTKETIKIKDGNIRFLFTFKEKIYFIEGLAHLGYSGGALFELDTSANNFSYKKRIDFDDAPQAFTIYRDKLLIVTFEGFCVVENFEKEILFKDTFWSSLYPNSIAVFDEENVFVGIRGGIVKLDLTTKTFTFFMADK